MKGKEQAYGEETELFHRIRIKFRHTIIYDPSLYVYHLVHAEKMKMEEVVRNGFISGLDYAKGIPTGY